MRIKEGFVIREMCGEYIVTGESVEYVDFNKMLSLNATAAYLWKEVVHKDFDLHTLIDLLVRKYNVSEEQASADAANLCQIWKEAGVIE